MQRTKREQHDLLIHDLLMYEVESTTSTPTVVYYDREKPVVGYHAIHTCADPAKLNSNFKVAFGAKPRSKHITLVQKVGDSKTGSVFGVTNDFCQTIINAAVEQMVFRLSATPRSIMIAEPVKITNLSAAEDAEWLNNYRSNLRSIFQNAFDNIDFMPEPFAVYQYYRHGFRHPEIADHSQKVVLVIDFGGGTFDVSIIETTKSGDISQSGRNARPLSAASIPLGGFAINEILAREILFRNIDKKEHRQKLKKAFDDFTPIQSVDIEQIESVNDALEAFLRNMKHMLLSVERAKVEICRKITRWSLDADLSSIPSFPIDVPSEPFSSEAAWHRYLLSAPELRDFFVNQVWRSRLKGPTSEAIKRAQHELRGRPIDVVLFSGGSSNIRWLRTLMESDFSATFDETRVIDLQHDFQEVVAKGLAIECARRFYTRGEGDFNGVTYNSLHLMLGANDYVDPEIPRFRPATDDLKDIRLDDGVLIPSASSLRPFMERGLQWRTSLRSAPSRHLDYFFLRSSFNHCDVNALQNIQERRVYTPSGTKFGAGFDVKLFVKEDGTAFPQFIYGKGKQENATTVDGRPFYLDMTTVSKKMNIDCYIGFDFGTSNSSACFVSREHIESRRSVRSPKTWLALSDAEPELPYPVSRSVAEYLAEPTQAKGRAAVEQALSFATFVAYAEYRSLTPRQRTKLFSVLARRSAGPLWHCLKQLLDAFGDRAKWCSALARFQEPAANDLIENTVNAIASEKHEGPKVDINQCLELLVNRIVVMMQGRYFGVFENVHKRRLRKAFEGYFRCLHGRRGPFITVGDYQGNEPISNECVFLWDSRLGEALELSPLYLYGLNTAFGRDFEEPEMFFYDACRDQRVTFRAIGGGDPLVFSRDKEEEEFIKEVIELFDGDNEKSTLECVNVIFE